MLTRDAYIAILEKRAADEAVDSQQVALKDYSENADDNRKYLGGLFDEASATQKEQSKQMDKLFPGKSKKESGNPLMKVAHEVFLEAVQETGVIKNASPAYLEVAFHAFTRELEKVAVSVNWVRQRAARGAFARSASPAGEASVRKSTLRLKSGGNAPWVGAKRMEARDAAFDALHARESLNDLRDLNKIANLRPSVSTHSAFRAAAPAAPTRTWHIPDPGELQLARQPDPSKARRNAAVAPNTGQRASQSVARAGDIAMQQAASRAANPGTQGLAPAVIKMRQQATQKSPGFFARLFKRAEANPELLATLEKVAEANPHLFAE